MRGPRFRFFLGRWARSRPIGIVAQLNVVRAAGAGLVPRGRLDDPLLVRQPARRSHAGHDRGGRGQRAAAGRRARRGRAQLGRIPRELRRGGAAGRSRARSRGLPAGRARRAPSSRSCSCTASSTPWPWSAPPPRCSCSFRSCSRWAASTSSRRPTSRSTTARRCWSSAPSAWSSPPARATCSPRASAWKAWDWRSPSPARCSSSPTSGSCGSGWEQRLALGALVVPLLKLLAASVPAAAGAAAVCLLGDWDQGPASPRNWVVLPVAGLAGASIYAGLAWTFHVPELRDLARRMRARRGSDEV